MTQIEEKRIEYISEKHPEYSSDKVEFLVRTGLTFQPEKLRSNKSEEEKHLDWYYPKGAAFKNSQSDDSDDSSDVEDIANQISSIIDADPDPEVITIDPDTQEETTTPLEPNSTVTVITNDDNEVFTDANGNIIITND